VILRNMNLCVVTCDDCEIYFCFCDGAVSVYCDDSVHVVTCVTTVLV
jgi:hypothetical protein